MRQSTSLAVRFALFHEAKDALRGANGGRALAWHAPLAGAFCGAVGVALNNPIDVAKSRLQASVQQLGRGAPRPTMVGTLQQLVREEGVLAMYKGVVPRMTKIAVGQAIVFGVYDRVHALTSSSPPSR